jgi:hypothetical protein
MSRQASRIWEMAAGRSMGSDVSGEQAACKLFCEIPALQMAEEVARLRVFPPKLRSSWIPLKFRLFVRKAAVVCPDGRGRIRGGRPLRRVGPTAGTTV